jgi:hypothetical protein
MAIGVSGQDRYEKRYGAVRGYKETQKQLSQEAIDKLVYDALSGAGGLADLVTMGNTTGGSNSSSTQLMSQDFMTKVIGELANVTATTREDYYEREDKKKINKEFNGSYEISIICTYLAAHGYINRRTYLRGLRYYATLHPQIIRGYHTWARVVIALMPKHEWLRKFFTFVANRRYDHLMNRERNFTGWCTVKIVEPICYVIGYFVPAQPESAGALANGSV